MTASHQNSYNSGLKALSYSPPGTGMYTATCNAAEALAEEGTCPKARRGGQLHRVGLYMQKGLGRGRAVGLVSSMAVLTPSRCPGSHRAIQLRQDSTVLQLRHRRLTPAG